MSRGRRLPIPVDFGGMLAGRLSKRYAAGPDAADALAVAADLRSAGLLVMCEYVAHPARTPADADTAADRLADLLRGLRATGLAGVDLLVPGGSLGWGAAGEARLRRLCEAASEASTQVTVRPTSHTEVAGCLELVARLRDEHPDTGVEVWASLLRTAGDLTALLADSPPGPRVLLRTEGEGSRPAAVALPTATDVDRAFIRYARRLLGGVARPVLAADDPTLVVIAESLATRGGDGADPRPTQWLEFVMDMGRQGEEIAMLSALRRDVRIKVPFGPRWRATGLRQLRADSPRIARLAR